MKIYISSKGSTDASNRFNEIAANKLKYHLGDQSTQLN